MFKVSGWVAESCYIISSDKDIATFAIFENGLFSLIPESRVAASSIIPPYLIVGFTIFGVLLWQFCNS